MSLDPCVDVVIPTFNGRSMVLRCSEHLCDLSVASVIVVDDASEDGTVEALATRNVRVVGLTRHRGLAHALNQGAAAGSARFILFLNNDVFPAPGAIDLLVRGLLAQPAAGSAAGRLVEPGTDATQSTYLPRAIPGPAALAVRLTGVERLWPRNPVTGQHLRRPLSEVTPTLTNRQPAGACLLVPRQYHENIGGWDERYWIWYEDVDYSRRLALRHGPAFYDPRALFRHVGGASTTHWGKPEQHRRLYQGTLQYGNTHFGVLGRIVLGVTAVAVSIPRVLVLRNKEAQLVYRQVARGGISLCLGRGSTFVVSGGGER